MRQAGKFGKDRPQCLGPVERLGVQRILHAAADQCALFLGQGGVDV
jgi:hypothetical protein